LANEDRELQVVNIRMVREPSLYSETPIRSPQDVLDVVARELSAYDREVFAVLNLKTNGQIINMNICSIGTLNASMVNGREVFKSAILSNAGSFICFHVHPSGCPEPSEEDKTVTEKLATAGKYLDIPLLDHCIIAGGTGEMYSFKANGLMDEIRQNMRTDICER
jgi:DNA repair protein RadC